MSNPHLPHPPFFDVPAPQHFAVRTDLFEELCLTEQFLQSLPRNPTEHARWLRITGATPEEQPLSALRPDRFRAGQRFILHKVALPGNTYASPLVRLENGWAGFTQASGLPEFIFERAVQYAASRGVPADIARRQLMPPHLADSAQRRSAPWAIGIARDSGHAVVLHAGHAHAFGHYLAGERSIITPSVLAR